MRTRLEPIMPRDLANQFNPSPSQADFTYSITPSTVEIQDMGKGKKSVADDLEAVLRKIEFGTRARSLVIASATGAPRGRVFGQVGRANGASF